MNATCKFARNFRYCKNVTCVIYLGDAASHPARRPRP
jgi:hypothetical protein